MKRMIVPLMTLLLMLVPLASLAQVRDPVAEEISRAVTQLTPPVGPSPSAKTVAASSDEGQVVRPAVQPARPSRPLVRRRGSMVGYIDDAIVETKARLRVDDGLHIHAPDRAEFFYAKCGCYRDLEGNPLFDPHAPGPGPGIANDVNFKQIVLQGEYAFTNRFSAQGELPLRLIQPQGFKGGGPGFSNHSGLGDIQMGFKYEALSRPNSVATVNVRAFLPTGNASLGLGTNHATIQPALLWYQRFSDRLVVESQVGEWRPIGGSLGLPDTSIDKFSGNVFFYGIGPSYEVYRRGEVSFAPVVELVGWRVLAGSQTASVSDATGTNIVNLKFGGRVAWESEGSLYVGWGHAMTSTWWYQNILRIEYRLEF